MRPVLLDVRRLAGRTSTAPLTGIDRVELAYLRGFLASDRKVWFLARVRGGFALLDRGGMAGLLPMLNGQSSRPRPDLWGRLLRRGQPERGGLETALRRAALGLCAYPMLARMLRRHLPEGFAWIHVGHSRVTQWQFDSLRRGGAGLCMAMVHDLIPLELPETTQPGMPARFEQIMSDAARNCDILIANSHDTARRLAPHLARWGSAALVRAVPLGVDPLPAAPGRSAPGGSDVSGRPAFVTLGTIEPRKNHRLLLDLWAGLMRDLPPGQVPMLHVVGRRGWMNADVFADLDSAPMMGMHVFEHNNLSDAELAGLMAGARALLFPSRAEGYGYPLAEALQMRLPVIASDLPVFRELAGDVPTYLSPDDLPGWRAAVLAASAHPPPRPPVIGFPGWAAHISAIESFL